MAPRGSKRAAVQVPTEEPGAKRVADFLSKQGVTKPSYDPVLEALHHPLSGLSESDLRMVLAVLPWSLAVPADERHEAQEAALQIVDSVMENVRAELEKVANIEGVTVDELKATKEELEGQVQRTEAAQAQVCQAVEEGKAKLAEVEVGVAPKQATLDQAELEHKRVKADLEQVQAPVTELEEMLSGSLTKLKSRELGQLDALQVDSLVQSVLAVAKKVQMEEAMVATLPASLAKPEKGSFDEVVIHQAEQCFRDKLAALSTVAHAARGPATAQAAVVQAAQAELDAELAQHTQAAARLRGAQEASAESAAAVKAAIQAVAKLDAKLAVATATQAGRQAELDQFCAYNICLFKVLRDRTAPKQQVEEEAGSQPDADMADSKDRAEGRSSSGSSATLAGA